jgi:hypothetical protein
MDMKMATLSDLNILDVGNALQMAGAVYIGKGKLYLAMFPDEHGDVYDGDGNTCVEFIGDDGQKIVAETLNMSQDDWALFIRQTDLLEVEALSKGPDGGLMKIIVRKSQRQIEQGVSWQVFRRDAYRCRYCANDATPLTVDHLVCWEAGGPSTVGNLVAACRKCNKVRGDLPYKEWLLHPHYLKVSKNLDEATRQANQVLVETLDAIPRRLHQRSR